MSGNAPREIELKLDVDPAEASALTAHLAELFGDAAARRLRSVYYDTPDQALRARGMSLRVRTGDGPPIQTVKRVAGPQAGMFDRDEWETLLPDDRPDLQAFANTPAAAGLSIELADLAPAFETVIRRTVWHATQADGEIELALDIGCAVAEGFGETFSELELELKAGEPRHLFSVLSRLNGTGSLRPGVQTKSERGYRLVAGRAPRCLKAEPLHLDKHKDAAAAFKAVVHACLRHFWLNEPLLVATRAPEALHQSRVALRRLRSALSLFKPVVADAIYLRLGTALQDVSRHLGEARNLDVYLNGTVRPAVEAGPAEFGGAPYLAAVTARRETAYDEVLERLRSARFRQTMMDLLAWTEAGPWLTDADPTRQERRATPIRAFAAALLDKRRRRVKRRGRHLATLDADARHRLRIEAKKLRYASEFFAGLASSEKARDRHATFTHALEHLQDHLGSLNDIATGHAIAACFAQCEAGTQTGLLAAVQVDEVQEAKMASLLAEAEGAHRHFVEAKRFWSGWPR